MLQQFPDSTLVPQARQRLREVQETLAAREAYIAAFYATHTKLCRRHRPLPDRGRHLPALQPHGRRADRPGRLPMRPRRRYIRTLAAARGRQGAPGEDLRRPGRAMPTARSCWSTPPRRTSRTRATGWWHGPSRAHTHAGAGGRQRGAGEQPRPIHTEQARDPDVPAPGGHGSGRHHGRAAAGRSQAHAARPP